MLLLAKPGTGNQGGPLAQAIDFDGFNSGDTLTSSIGLYGQNATISLWVYPTDSSEYIIEGESGYFYIDTSLSIYYYELSNNQQRLQFSSANQALRNTWNHILISVGFTQGSANSRVFLNDVQVSGSWSSFVSGSTFSVENLKVSGSLSNASGFNGRISNVYIDSTYRDLTVTANRRLFVTADLKPAANQANLNPLVYLPMDDPTQPGKNLGTGGNFTLVGNVARSGRGPNQYNVAYSSFNGSSAYLYRNSDLTGIADNKLCTFNISFNPTAFGTALPALFMLNSGTSDFRVALWFDSATGNNLKFALKSPGGTQIAEFTLTVPSYKANSSFADRNYILTVSLDLSDVNKRHVYLNGLAPSAWGYSLVWNSYTNNTIDWTAGTWEIGRYNLSVTRYYQGNIGALWLDNSYIDLSIPANLAKFVEGTGSNAKPVDLGVSGELPTGISPKLYLLMYGNNAGKNYGTGGDFLTNSAPYSGTKGPNEFWGNRADFDGLNYLTRSSVLTNIVDSKTFSLSFWFTPDDAGQNDCLFSISDASGSIIQFFVLRNTSNQLRIYGRNPAGSIIFDAVSAVNMPAGSTHHIQMCIDLTNTAKRFLYINGVNQTSTVTWTTYTNDFIDFTGSQLAFAAYRSGGSYTFIFNGRISEFYLTPDYIDFSQEANRLKFRNPFGYFVDLSAQIQSGAIPNPAVYMRFEPGSTGTNSGTGGDFTPVGNILDGGQL